MKFLVYFISIISLSACTKSPERVKSGQPDFQVNLLFEKDGCKVYRFKDSEQLSYYSDCRPPEPIKTIDPLPSPSPEVAKTEDKEKEESIDEYSQYLDSKKEYEEAKIRYETFRKKFKNRMLLDPETEKLLREFKDSFE